MNRKVYSTRIVMVSSLIFLLFILLLRHLYHVQITRHDELLQKARLKYTEVRTTHGERGRIYDGCRIPSPNLLAISKGCYDIFGLPQNKALKGKKDIVITQLSELLNIEKDVLEKRFYSKKKQIVVQRQVDLDIIDQLKESQLPGLRFVASTKRYFPKGDLAAQIIGFLNSKGNGVMGIEAMFNKHLSPQEGRIRTERTRKNERIYTGNNAVEEQKVDGMDIYLTIKEPIQSIVEEEVAKMVEKFPCKAAYAIMADPKNGDILAMAQWPTYNANDRSTMNPDTYRNRMLEDGIEPGSVMKAISIAGVLNLHPEIGLNTKFYCEKGRWLHAGKILRDAGHAYKYLSVKEIIQKSSNIGTAKLALRVGEREMYRNLLNFQFGKRTGLKLGTESPGLLLPQKKWDKLTLSRYAMGQGLICTPLQMVQAYCAIANNGAMPQLRIVKKAYDKASGEFIHYEPQIKRQVLRPTVARTMVKALKTVTQQGGTAKQAAVPGFATAGKTGTSQKVEGVYNEQSFIRLAGRNDLLKDSITTTDRHNKKYRTITLRYNKQKVEKALRYQNSYNYDHDDASVMVKNHKTGKRAKKSARFIFSKDSNGQIRRRISLRVGGFYSDRYYVASFMGFVPADKPRFVLYIVVDEPVKSKGYYGGVVCGPTFRAISEKTLKYMNVFPEQSNDQ